ncbi:MAG: phosphatase PAP2 family protein [Acidimicrobiales bacterium]
MELLPTPPPAASAPPLDPNPSAPLSELPAGWRAVIRDFDARVDRELDRLRGNPVADRIFYWATELGDFGLLWHLIGASRGLRDESRGKEALRLTGVLALESVLVNGIIKSFFRRHRPEWDQPRAHKIRRPRSSSFPSGHASAAFTAATLLGDDDPLRPLYFGLAAVVATSRVYVKIHHASDVVGGIATGLVLGQIVKRAGPRRKDPRR